MWWVYIFSISLIFICVRNHYSILVNTIYSYASESCTCNYSAAINRSSAASGKSLIENKIRREEMFGYDRGWIDRYKTIGSNCWRKLNGVVVGGSRPVINYISSASISDSAKSQASVSHTCL